MAVVYLARDKKHDRPVAIKILHPEIVAGTGADRFLLEIRTLARLQHPHILALLLLHRDRDAEPTVRPRGTRRGTGPGHARHTQGSVGPDEPVTCSGDGLRAWTAPLRLPLVAGRYRRVGQPQLDEARSESSASCSRLPQLRRRASRLARPSPHTCEGYVPKNVPNTAHEIP